MPPPQPFEFPFAEAATLQTAIGDLKAALDGLVMLHLDHVDEIRGTTSTPYANGREYSESSAFTGAARGAFDTLFDAALEAVSTVAADLGTDAGDLDAAVGEAYTAAAERAQEIADYEAAATVPPRPPRDPDAPLGG